MSEFQNITPTLISEYADSHTSDLPTILQELERETCVKCINPRMLSGKLQGQFLNFICRMMKPKNILEIGTFTGYSALSMVYGMPEKSHLYTIEANPEQEEIIRKYIKKSGFSEQITLIIADAKTEISKFENDFFELIFLDADKINYPLYYELLMPKLKKGGMLIADNTLWSGAVVSKTSTDKEVVALQTFNDLVQNDSQTQNLLLPFRDGLMCVMRLS
ncbi:MAG: O-methyltransferase [Bacteroidales bacterium]|jgi:predicted O-methyltransferase YrrM|nr:O-methyltransferase [Bacteroidales bacterium]